MDEIVRWKEEEQQTKKGNNTESGLQKKPNQEDSKKYWRWVWRMEGEGAGAGV